MLFSKTKKSYLCPRKDVIYRRHFLAVAFFDSHFAEVVEVLAGFVELFRGLMAI